MTPLPDIRSLSQREKDAIMTRIDQHKEEILRFMNDV